MKKVKIKIKTMNGMLPEYQSSGSSGADVCAYLENDVVIEKGSVALIPTGLFVEIPGGYEAQIRPRSGLALKHGITLLNTPGTIDSDYRGEIKIIMANLGPEPFTVKNGMRIGQMVINRVYRADFLVTDTLRDTERSDGGFGHTGV